MPYAPTTWVDGVTPVNAANLNKLEVGLQNAVGVPADTVVAFNAFLLRNELAGADTQPAFRLMGDGKIEWGPGGTTAPDTSLIRYAANILRTPGEFRTGSTISIESGAAGHGVLVRPSSVGGYALHINIGADAQPQFFIATNGGSMSWGPGGAAATDVTLSRIAQYVLACSGFFNIDANSNQALKLTGAVAGIQFGGDATVYRSAANYLKMNGSLAIGGASTGELKVQEGLFEVAIGRFGPAAEGGIRLGGDVNLYRAGADLLKTDDGLYVGPGGISLRTDGQIEAGTNLWMKSDAGKLYFGVSFDAQIARQGVNSLVTPGTFSVGGNLTIAASQVISLGASAYIYSGASGVGNAVLISRASGDTGNRFTLTAGGTISWGDGTAAGDTNLYRSSADALRTDDLFSVNRTNDYDTAFATKAAADSLYRFRMSAGGGMEWGPGGAGAVDTNLYRSAADTLKTDDSFHAGSGIVAKVGLTSQVALGDVGGGTPGIYFGNAADTYLSRLSAGVVGVNGVAIGADLSYEGAHVPATSHQEGDIIISGGVAYICVRPTTATPSWPGTPQTFGYGTSLPGSPVDGQEYTLVDSLTAPTYAWRFRYTAGISDAYKWVFVGGGPLATTVDAAEATASATYVALTTPGPSVVLPRAGIYVIEHGFHDSSGANSAHGFMSFDIGGTAAVDADAVFTGSSGSGVVATTGSFARTNRKTIATAVTLTSKYKSATGTKTLDFRWLQAIPIRVS